MNKLFEKIFKLEIADSNKLKELFKRSYIDEMRLGVSVLLVTLTANFLVNKFNTASIVGSLLMFLLYSKYLYDSRRSLNDKLSKL